MASRIDNGLMVTEIIELLKRNNLCNGTCIYYNNKMIICREGQIEVIEEEVRVDEVLEWCNPETITMTYEGNDSIYFYINSYKVEGLEEEAKRVREELHTIGNKYKGYYELGTDSILYFIPDEDISKDELGIVDFEKYHYPK